MRVITTTAHATYVWDTERPYSRNSQRIEVFERGNTRGNVIDAWGESISTEDEFHAAITRREAATT